MDNSSRYRILFFSSIAIFLGVIFSIYWYLAFVNPYLTYQVYTQDSVSGLLLDAPVEFHGVEVGSVKNIELINPYLVKILLQINKTAPITMGTAATIISRGLSNKGFTGSVYISLEDTKIDSRPLTTLAGNDYPTIPSKPSRIITLDMAINKLGKNAQKISDIFDSLLDRQTIHSLKELIRSLQQVSKTLAMNNKKLNSLIINTEKASYKFQPLLDSSNHMISILETQILPKAYSSLSNLDNLTDTLSIMVNKLKQDPSMLVRGVAPAAPGPGETK